MSPTAAFSRVPGPGHRAGRVRHEGRAWSSACTPSWRCASWGSSPAHRLVFLFNSDEEVGSPTSRPFIEAEARRSDAALVLEPSRDDALVTWRKGVGRFELEIQGVASHSGAAHERGVSAVEELAHQILRLEAMTDYGRGTTVNVGVVEGGSKVNVRPASAWAAIDLRVLDRRGGPADDSGDPWPAAGEPGDDADHRRGA